jgi:competence protein ComEA
MTRANLTRWASVPLVCAAVLWTAVAIPGQTAPQTLPGPSKSKSRAKAKADKVVLDLNKATAQELRKHLPGVGVVTARKIVAGRPYTKVDDLAKAGVAKRVIEAIRPQVRVGDAPTAKSNAGAAAAKVKAADSSGTAKPAPGAAQDTPKQKAGRKVNINTASKAELDALPGIGRVKAQGIIDARPFKTIEDIMKVSGIKEGEFAKIKDLITVK